MQRCVFAPGRGVLGCRAEHGPRHLGGWTTTDRLSTGERCAAAARTWQLPLSSPSSDLAGPARDRGTRLRPRPRPPCWSSWPPGSAGSRSSRRDADDPRQHAARIASIAADPDRVVRTVAFPDGGTGTVIPAGGQAFFHGSDCRRCRTDLNTSASAALTGGQLHAESTRAAGASAPMRPRQDRSGSRQA
jgi:hypothetical protein